MTIRTRRVAGLCLALAVLALAPVLCAPVLGAQQSALEQKLNADEEGLKALHAWHDIQPAMVRLPLAALLGAALALRPRRRGTPKRTPAVVQTQIVLAVVGAVIMLVVGASLARAFGIVGAANLIRYRSKIDDPKDAVVMLCALAVGLASGVGLYALGVFSTAFLVAALWVIESFEPQGLKRFDLKIKAGKDTDALRPARRSSSGTTWTSSCGPRRTTRFATMCRCRSSSRPTGCPTPSSSSIPRATAPSNGPRRRTR